MESYKQLWGAEIALDRKMLESAFTGAKQAFQSYLGRYYKWRFRPVSCQIYTESCGKFSSLTYNVTCCDCVLGTI